MTEPIPAYQSLVTARSRRLRVIGTLLLAGVIAMSVYGATVLMPMVNHAVAAHRALLPQATTGSLSTPANSALTPEQKHIVTALKVQIVFAYAYWGVCALLILAALFTAWLYLREVSRNYLEQRRTLWTEAAVRSRAEAPRRDNTSIE